MNEIDARVLKIETWRTFVDSLDFKPKFVTVSGAHLYGFPSPDSDVDLRGCHQLPLAEIVGLSLPTETIDRSTLLEGIEVDIVSHDIGKYFQLLVKNNGYVLEQIFSPLVVEGQEFLDELRPIAKRCITRHHYHHYRGFLGSQKKILGNQEVKKAKSLLYAYRVALTGIHLMRTGIVEASILVLNEEYQRPYIEDLIAMKKEEKIGLEKLDWDFHSQELNRLESELEERFTASKLPEDRDREAVNEFLVRLRLSV